MENNPLEKICIGFFGTSDFSVYVLETLKENGIVPTVVITQPDKAQGRGLVLLSSPVKNWALSNNIPVLEPQKLTADFVQELEKIDCDLFIVASYGKIIPETIINLPKYKTLNIHPSLLPKYRGATPIQSTILNGDAETGVSIILLDREMDHGPIVAIQKIKSVFSNKDYSTLEKELAELGGKLLLKVFPDWISQKTKAVEQNHTLATFTKKIVKEDGEIVLSPENSLQNYRKFLAFKNWPRIFFFLEKNGKKIRIKITDAEYKNNIFTPLKVVPEGKKEMSYSDFLKGYGS